MHLCDFFRFYCEFDYANKAVDVRGDGSFFEKPELGAIQKKAKQQAGGLRYDGPRRGRRRGRRWQ